MDLTKNLKDLAKIARAEDDEAFQRAIQACEYNPKLIEKVERLFSLSAWERDNLISPDPFPPPVDEIAGDVEIGRVMQTGKSVKLTMKELLQGTLICGRSGAGKTNLAFYIVRQLCEE